MCAYLIGLSVLYCILSLILYLWNKDDEYRELQLRDVMMESRQSRLAKGDEREEEEREEDSEQEVGQGRRGMVGSTMMGSVASGVSTQSLFSSDNGSDGTVTMMGFAGEDEPVVLRFKGQQEKAGEEEEAAAQDGDHSSALSVITDDEHCERDRLL